MRTYRGREIHEVKGRGWLDCGYRWFVPHTEGASEDDSPHFRTEIAAREYIDERLDPSVPRCCPRCGQDDCLVVVTSWRATSNDDPANICWIEEWQCGSKICCGASFWV